MENINTGIWHRDAYTTEDFDYIISKRITEYDMKDAGYNLSQYYQLLSQKKLDYLSTLEKHNRRVQIGIWMRDDKEFNKSLTEAFGKMRKLFIESNHLDDNDIISIKKDAIFVVSKTCDLRSYGNVTFSEKNVYSSYHKFGNIEMYYNHSKNILDIKGINDDLLYQHKCMIGILKRLFGLLETNDHDGFVRLMKNFVDDYKNCKLTYGYYRELNSNALYALKGNANDSRKYYVPDVQNHQFDSDLDISYNYINYILPMIQRFYFPYE